MLEPIAFTATTVNVHTAPVIRPVAVIGDVVPATGSPPDEGVTMYDVIADPPVIVGAVKYTAACVLLVAYADTAVGGLGICNNLKTTISFVAPPIFVPPTTVPVVVYET
jgi:hypothetical protein